jgi:acylglycerol lipase
MVAKEYSWIKNNGKKIAAKEWKPTGKPKAIVVIVHGIGEHSGRYQHVAEFFTKNGIGVFSFDILGHGRSEGKRGHACSYANICEDVQHSIDDAKKEFPETPIFLYGHSLGGELVLYHTIINKAKVNGIIGTGVCFRQTFPVPKIKFVIANIASKLMPALTMSTNIEVSNISRDPKVVHAYTTDPLVHPMISSQTGMDLLSYGEWLLANANKLHVPMLLMQGADDHLVDPKAVAEFARKAPKSLITYKEWKGLYHEIHNEPEQNTVLKYIVDWILKHLK